MDVATHATHDVDTFVRQAWREHADATEAVAARLDDGRALITDPAQVAPFASLAVHVLGEHLGRWHDGVAMLDRLAALDDGRSAALLARQRAMLRHMAGDADALAPLDGAERHAALALVASTATGRGALTAAIDALRQSLDGLDDALPDDAPVWRAIAVAGNNLACSLEELPSRSDAQVAAMLMAAEAGLRGWRRAGGWLEEERAQYRLACSRLQAGQAEAARDAARACLRVCQVNDAPAFERFFAQAVLALAERACGDEAACLRAREAAATERERLDDDERRWTDDDWARLANDAA